MQMDADLSQLLLCLVNFLFHSTNSRNYYWPN